MKDRWPGQSIEHLCKLFDKTRQAWHKRQRTIYAQAIEEQVVLEGVRKIRSKMPRLGTRKLVKKLEENGFKIGRDDLFNILRANNLLVRRRRVHAQTTQSSHWLRKYPNLIRDFEPSGPNQLWVSDITYVETLEGFLYLFLITDAYSKKIVGYCMAQTLHAIHAETALEMAIASLPSQHAGLTHHSDRGVQYCSERYVALLNRIAAKISMSEKGDPLENAVAERVNGILKDEWIYEWEKMKRPDTVKAIEQIIAIYNEERPHLSINLMTPNAAHQQNGRLKRHWKNTYAAVPT